jgi:hypothetical protein
VNKPSHRMTAHQPQQPQNSQYYCNRPQHFIILSIFSGPQTVWVLDTTAETGQRLASARCAALFPHDLLDLADLFLYFAGLISPYPILVSFSGGTSPSFVRVDLSKSKCTSSNARTTTGTSAFGSATMPAPLHSFTVVTEILQCIFAVKIFLFFIAVTPLCKYDCELVYCETFSANTIRPFSTIASE